MDNRIDAVIFDMDGVLIDSEPLHFESDRLTIQEYGSEISDEVMIAYVGATGEKFWSDMKPIYGITDSLEVLLQKQKAHKEQLFSQSLQSIAGIPQLLSALQAQGKGLAVASSSPRYFIDMVLDGLGLRQFFPVIVSGDDISNCKPAPDIFIKAAEQLGVSADNCVVIEDSGHGVTAAKAANMRCIGLITPNSGPQDLSPADIIIESVYDCFNYLGV